MYVLGVSLDLHLHPALAGFFDLFLFLVRVFLILIMNGYENKWVALQMKRKKNLLQCICASPSLSESDMPRQNQIIKICNSTKLHKSQKKKYGMTESLSGLRRVM